ncbi:hypothetical protein HMPREF3191_00764 [Veillonellaceae bacterium DNF00626]|nr:hypothetical protein HMPREF3191_00764 [Veillonellaceae bacterium DNF00626]
MKYIVHNLYIQYFINNYKNNLYMKRWGKVITNRYNLCEKRGQFLFLLVIFPKWNRDNKKME